MSEFERAREDLDELFEKAIQLPMTERAAFLDYMCLGQPELRWQLELMLTHRKHQPPDDFMEPEALPGMIKGR